MAEIKSHFLLKQLGESSAQQTLEGDFQTLGFSPDLSRALTQGISDFLGQEQSLCYLEGVKQGLRVEVPLERASTREQRINPRNASLLFHEEGAVTVLGEDLYVHAGSIAGCEFRPEVFGQEALIFKTDDREVSFVRDNLSGRVTIHAAI